MSKLVWDQTSERLYETGVEMGAVYPQSENGTYPAGAAWNGLISVTESPSGAEATPLYANDKKYLELTSAEELGFSISAYTYPEEFEACNGTAAIATGVSVGQQTRQPFGLVYKSLIGNDVKGTDYGYKLHIYYNAKAAPSEQAHSTVNDSPEAMELSWECTTTAVEVPGHKPAASITIDSTKADPDKLKALEAILYGSEEDEARLPLPEEIIQLMSDSAAG